MANNCFRFITHPKFNLVPDKFLIATMGDANEAPGAHISYGKTSYFSPTHSRPNRNPPSTPSSIRRSRKRRSGWEN